MRLTLAPIESRAESSTALGWTGICQPPRSQPQTRTQTRTREKHQATERAREKHQATDLACRGMVAHTCLQLLQQAPFRNPGLIRVLLGRWCCTLFHEQKDQTLCLWGKTRSPDNKALFFNLQEIAKQIRLL